MWKTIWNLQFIRAGQHEGGFTANLHDTGFNLLYVNGELWQLIPEPEFGLMLAVIS